jgi:diguanylate cyclase (GGDEF)-like protein/PAS domain S-box-containing protein
LQGSHGRSSTIHADHISDGASFRTIFDDAPIAIIQLDLEGRCLSCNSAAQRIFGYEESDMVQLRTTHLLADSSDDDVFELFERLVRTPRRREVRLRRRDGGLFWSSITVSVVSDDTGQPCFAYVMAEDLSERRGAEDLVTGLPNRALFVSQVAHSLRAGRRDGRGMALLMLDLDRFKGVNDTFGHAAGDDLLKQVSERLTTILRASDIIARIGGDEFAVLLIGTSDRRAVIDVARKIRGALKVPFDLGVGVVTVGASIGIARCPRTGSTVETLMGQADVAMYTAKRTGSGYHTHREMRMKDQS